MNKIAERALATNSNSAKRLNPHVFKLAGAGGIAMTNLLLAATMMLPPAPAVAPTKPKPTYVAAVAYNDLGESAYSNEVVTTNSWGATFAWNPSINATGYILYSGTNSGQYQHWTDVGNVTNATVYFVPLQTNIWKVQPQFSTNMANWTAAGPAWSFTNTAMTNQNGFWRLQVQQQ